MRITIKDVARAAGVSVATVSRVFNDSGPVSPVTRTRIREVASRLRYTPDEAARSLIMRRTSTIGVFLPDLYGEFYSEVIRGIDQTARARGYHILVSGSHNDPDELDAAFRAMRGRVDGLIVMSPALHTRALVRELPETLPVVLLNSPRDGDFADSVVVDNVGGARAMVRHLATLGHTRIAIICGAPGNHDSAERLKGYRSAMTGRRTAGWEIAGDFTEKSGYEAVASILTMRPRPTAIFASNDSMAIGALSALREAGIRVPADMAVVGFDDIPLARYMSPPLSSVHVAIDELGARATTRLLDALTEKAPRGARKREVLKTRLMVRESCGARGRGGRSAGSRKQVPGKSRFSREEAGS